MFFHMLFGRRGGKKSFYVQDPCKVKSQGATQMFGSPKQLFTYDDLCFERLNFKSFYVIPLCTTEMNMLPMKLLEMNRHSFVHHQVHFWSVRNLCQFVHGVFTKLLEKNFDALSSAAAKFKWGVQQQCVMQSHTSTKSMSWWFVVNTVLMQGNRQLRKRWYQNTFRGFYVHNGSAWSCLTCQGRACIIPNFTISCAYSHAI